MHSLDRLIVNKDTRMQALGLLNAFVRLQPPHLYQVTKTSIIAHLLRCLLIDTSTVVLSLALNALIMFLPHIPSSVREHLPRLFLIYSRILVWERFSPAKTELSNDEKMAAVQEKSDEDDDDSENDTDADHNETEPEEWEKLESSFDTAESTTPELTHYFTFLYGLYPLNFMSYCRNPKKYLRRIGFPNAEEFDLDKAVIRTRTEQYSKLHIVNPAFFTTTVEDELEENKWLKSDPADVVAECLSLYLVVPETGDDTLQVLPELQQDMSTGLTADSDIDPFALPISKWRSPQYSSGVSGVSSVSNIEPLSLLRKGSVQDKPTSAVTSTGAVPSPVAKPVNITEDSPTLPPSYAAQELRRMSRTPAPGKRASSVASTLRSATAPSPHMDALQASTRAEMSRSPALRPAPEPAANMAFLQREVMLLKNDLNFERYLKQQHLAHIGQLQRSNIREAAIEAETQNLINTNRMLKDKLLRSQKAMNGHKKEMRTSRDQSKKFEVDLTNKLKALKEEERTWRATEQELSVSLQQAQHDLDESRKLIVTAESEALRSKQETQLSTDKLEQVTTLQQKITTLEQKLHDYETRELQFKKTQDERTAMEVELETARMRLTARSNDHENTIQTSDNRIAELEAQLFAARNPTSDATTTNPIIPGQLAPAVQHMIDIAVASITEKYSNLKTEYRQLRHHFRELDAKNKALEAEIATAAASSPTSPFGGPASPFGPGSFSTTATAVPIRPSRRDTDIGSLYGQSQSFSAGNRSIPIPPGGNSNIGSSFSGLRNVRHGHDNGESGTSPFFPGSPSSFSNRQLALSRTISSSTPLKGDANATLASSPSSSRGGVYRPMIASPGGAKREKDKSGGVPSTSPSKTAAAASSFYENPTSAFSEDSLSDAAGSASKAANGRNRKSSVGITSNGKSKVTGMKFGRSGLQSGPSKQQEAEPEVVKKKEKRDKSTGRSVGGLLGIRGIL